MKPAATDPAAPRRRSPTPRWAPYLFVAPYVALTLAFFAYPFVHAIELAFYQTAGPNARVWVGLGNFRYIMSDPDFGTALYNTVLFSVVGTAIMIPTSLGLALALNSRRGGLKGFFRLCFFAPSVVGQIFVGIIFAVVLAPDYGLLNRFLQALVGRGLETRWLENPSTVMPAIVLTNLWLYAGFNMVYFLAALQNVNQDLVDAARIDGAGRWRIFRHITLPAIRPVVVFVLLISTIGSFQLFELPYALMRGTTSPYGPDNSALFIVGYLYDAAYSIGDLGLASAVGWVLALIILTVSLVQLKLTGASND
ncbi:MAG TPA: sugar ABC transporter permease [Opitutaceae bacterium]|nr:sugar ABC transporter permease [Opitutaceae bacterium]